MTESCLDSESGFIKAKTQKKDDGLIWEKILLEEYFERCNDMQLGLKQRAYLQEAHSCNEILFINR